MNREYWEDSFKDLKQAIMRLREMYDKAIGSAAEESEANRDSVIKRFEFTIELFWKTLKKLLRYEGIEAHSPREVVSQSYIRKMIDDDKIWFKMLDDRNLTSHVYKEACAREIFERIALYLQLFEETYKNLEKRYEKVS